jgi:hypothetical protein
MARYRTVVDRRALLLAEKEAELGEYGDVAEYDIPEPAQVQVEEPEYDSIVAFATFLVDDHEGQGPVTFTVSDVGKLASRLQRSNRDVIAELRGYGLILEERMPERKVRGFTTSSNDRFYGPGAEKMYGGTGLDPDLGVASWGTGTGTKK